MVGRWTEHESKAREYVRSFIKSITTIHLQNRKTVLLPYLLTDARHAQEFEELANQCNAEYFEVYLSVEKDDAISRLLERGTWGEEGLPPVTKKDLPIIERDSTSMVQETKKRPTMISIHPIKNDIEKTYIVFLDAIGEKKIFSV